MAGREGDRGLVGEVGGTVGRLDEPGSYRAYTRVGVSRENKGKRPCLEDVKILM